MPVADASHTQSSARSLVGWVCGQSTGSSIPAATSTGETTAKPSGGTTSAAGTKTASRPLGTNTDTFAHGTGGGWFGGKDPYTPPPGAPKTPDTRPPHTRGSGDEEARRGAPRRRSD